MYRLRKKFHAATKNGRSSARENANERPSKGRTGRENLLTGTVE